VGAWKFSSLCIFDGALLTFDATDICALATLTLRTVTGTGGITYAANGTYQSSRTLTSEFRLTVPAKCFSADKTCAGLNARYAEQMQTDPALVSAACATAASDCVCQLSTRSAVEESGTYATSGTTLSTTPTGGSPSSDRYCVQGQELHHIAVDLAMPMGATGVATITAADVFTKP